MMIISLCGSSLDKFAVSLCKALEKFGGALLIQKDNITQKYLYDPSYIIYNSACSPQLNVSKAIVIENTDKDELAFSVFEEENFETKFNVGLNSTDDITVSSIGNSYICISILSSIKTLSGNELLPCELKIKNSSEYDVYVVLAVITILLLTDKINNEHLTDI